MGDRDADHENLPEVLPIFPLSGVLLLPRGKLPLNIFEPRYLAMTEEAWEGDRLIGMIQPSDEKVPEPPPVYRVGCAGRITDFAKTEDGRFLITLTGISRFHVRHELPKRKGYRRVRADWSSFARDAMPDQSRIPRDRLLQGLHGYFRLHGLNADWDAVRETPDEKLVTLLAMICPFSAGEKQALLEANDLAERARLMIAMVEMAAAERAQPEAGTARH
jgi:Lon protease-like protein